MGINGILCGGAAIALTATTAFAGIAPVDFESNPSGMLAEGTVFNAGNPFEFNVTSAGDVGGLALFDSDAAVSFQDPDLLVGSGNILILQDRDAGTNPNDSNEGGSIFFNFTSTVDLSEANMDLIDFNGNSASVFTLTDANGNTRAFSIPNEFTGDPTHGAPGIIEFDFVTQNQVGVGPGNPIAFFVDTGAFDITLVDTIEFALGGSGALDNFRAIPMPAPLALATAGLLGVAGIRRRG